MTKRLHWTVDYENDHQDRIFPETVLSLLQLGASAGKNLRFAVIPNHGVRSSGASPLPDLPLVYGSATVHKADAFSYEISYENEASGEALQLQYQCSDHPLRPLSGQWQINCSNKGPGAYRSFHARGQRDGDDIYLSFNNIRIRAAHLPSDHLLICNWTLLDNFPALIDNDTHFCVLDDLEKLKTQMRIRSIGNWGLDQQQLRGFALQGHGLCETYYWLNEQQQVVIMSNIFNTFIRMGDTA